MPFDKEKFDSDPKSEEFLDAMEYAFEKLQARKKKKEDEEKKKKKDDYGWFSFPGF